MNRRWYSIITHHGTIVSRIIILRCDNLSIVLHYPGMVYCLLECTFTCKNISEILLSYITPHCSPMHFYHPMALQWNCISPHVSSEYFYINLVPTNALYTSPTFIIRDLKLFFLPTQLFCI